MDSSTRFRPPDHRVGPDVWRGHGPAPPAAVSAFAYGVHTGRTTGGACAVAATWDDGA
jgi:hypothetical protein